MQHTEFNVIKSKEVNVKGYVHSQNADGTLNICFNFNTMYPSQKHLFRYTQEYLEKYYTPDGTLKWTLK